MALLHCHGQEVDRGLREADGILILNSCDVR